MRVGLKGGCVWRNLLQETFTQSTCLNNQSMTNLEEIKKTSCNASILYIFCTSCQVFKETDQKKVSQNKFIICFHIFLRNAIFGKVLSKEILEYVSLSDNLFLRLGEQVLECSRLKFLDFFSQKKVQQEYGMVIGRKTMRMQLSFLVVNAKNSENDSF